MSAYRDIVKHSGIYGLGQILARLGSLLLLPLYTHCLTPADYGQIAILDLAGAVLGIVMGGGIASAVTRYHFQAKTDRDVDRVWWTGLIFGVGVTTLVIAPTWLFRGTLASFVLGEESQGAYLLALVIPTIWITTVGQLGEFYFRVRKWSIQYVTISIVGVLLHIGLCVYFLVELKMGVAGVLWASLVAKGLTYAVMTLVLCWSRGRPAFCARLLGQLIHFGSPLIATSLLALVMHQADRYLLRVYTDMHEVGVYSLAYQIGFAINTLYLIPFEFVWSVAIYEIAKQENAKQVYVEVFRYFMIGLMLLMLGASLFARPIIELMATPEYAAAGPLIPIVCLAYLFFSMHLHFNVPVKLAKKTIVLLPAAIAAAVANVALNVALIPKIGNVGAALVSVVTFAIYSFVGLAIYRRIDRYKYPFGQLSMILAGMIGTYFACRWADRNEATQPYSLPISAVVWLLWAICLVGPPAVRGWRSQTLWNRSRPTEIPEQRLPALTPPNAQRTIQLNERNPSDDSRAADACGRVT